jgi:hypothetical protein
VPRWIRSYKKPAAQPKSWNIDKVKTQRLLISLILGLFLCQGTLMAEVIKLKNGKTVSGALTYQDDNYLTLRLQNGEMQIPADQVEEILTDEESERQQKTEEELRREELERRQREYTGPGLNILDRDRRIIREKTIAEIGRDDRRFELDRLIEAPTEDGNAADFYWTVLDSDRFNISRIVKGVKGDFVSYDLTDPIFDRVRQGAEIKTCRFYPEYVSYPIGLEPPFIIFGHYRTIAKGFCEHAEILNREGEPERARQELETALILGIHIGQQCYGMKQFQVSNKIQQIASEALAEYYLDRDNRDNYKIFIEFLKEKQNTEKKFNLKKREILYDFQARRFRDLVNYAENGDDIVLRAHAMNLLTLLKLAGEQRPMRRDILENIPLEYHSVFNSVTPGVSREIDGLLQEIRSNSSDPFLQVHAAELLKTNPIRLKAAVGSYLGN